VLKVTAVPSAAGAFVGVINVAVMVVELAPSARRDDCPAVRVIPTTGLGAGGGGGGVVLGGGVSGDPELGGGSSALCPPPPPAF
jgi:hypothetical protein